ncbi:MAG TPA: winged helix-turn-helix domain-containing protein [Vicinamibacterales bacterium]|nr:winged helix-turn-helix domain-containing protein [Vicinamibacterales bacterium]
MKGSPAGPGDLLYRFGGFVLDPVVGRLHHRDEEVPLPNRPFQVLLALVKHADRTVPKEELFNEIWAGVFVEENNLARHVSVLRKTLRNFEWNEYIQTVQGHGYRFCGVVDCVARAQLSLPPPEAVGNRVDLETVVDRVEVTATRADVPMVAEATRRSTVAGLVARHGYAVMALAVVVVATVAWTWRGRYARADVESSDPPHRLWQLTSNGRLDTEPTWSPDGRAVAFTSDRSGNFDIWVQTLGATTARQLTFNEGRDWQPAWSPDGQWLAVRSEGEAPGIYVISAAGGPGHRLVPNGYEPRWSPDGRTILFRDSMVSWDQKSFVVPASGGAPREVRPDVLRDFQVSQVEWCPNGRCVCVYGRHAELGWGFWNVPLAGGPPVRMEYASSVERRLRENGVRLSAFTWASDGTALYFEGQAEEARNIWRVRVDPQSGRWIDGPDRLTTGAGIETHVSVSPDGRQIAFSSRSERTRAWSLPLDPSTGRVSGDGTPITPDGADVNVLDMSGDGRLLTYRTARRGTDELWLRTLSNGPIRLGAIEQDARILQPRWSFDGMQVAYLRASRDQGGRQSVVLLNAATGSSQERTLPTPGAVTNVYDWAPGGHGVLVGCATTPLGIRALCELSVSASGDDRPARVLATDPTRNLTAARTSPNQAWITFVAIAGRSPTTSVLYVMPAGGGAWTPLTDGHFYLDKPRWSPDGRTIYFLSNRSGSWNVWRCRFDSARGRAEGDLEQITHFESPARMISMGVYDHQLQMSVVRNQLILPITETSGAIWILDHADR